MRGRFGDTTGRPYLEGRLVIPRLNLRGDISFCVYTGADRSLLMPLDGMRIGIDYKRLTGDTESVGIGGISRNFVERVFIAFAEPKRYLYVYNIELGIAPPSQDIMDIPSLLGREILNQWRMTYDATKSLLTFNVLSADYILPIYPERHR
ncbi:MAG: hypothetical protein HY687_01645 [Chloroflexi bacterium]|nr:hypothetical protein [Chloroflexota bacterium]